MALDKDTVENIARLARIHMTNDELETYRLELSNILTLVEKMNAADTEGVEAMFHPSDHGLRLRDDRVTESNQRERFQAIAPAVESGLYLVPKVIE